MGFAGAEIQELIRYAEDTYGAEPEFLWAKSPQNAVLRHRNGGKWFAALLNVRKKQLGIPGAGCIDILNVKCDPKLVASLLDGKSRLPAYHMNKEHWITLLLDGSVPADELHALLHMSYELTKP